MNALEILEHTLIGVGGEPPHSSGNCFSVRCDEGKPRRIVNFNLENLEALIERGLTWPIVCEPLGERWATIQDPRIGERWYSNRFCEVCCPQALLPITQLQAHQRDIARGRRYEGESYVSYDLTKKPEFE